MPASGDVGTVSVVTQPRGHLPDGIYHATIRGAGPIPVFLDDDDRTLFCARLTRTMREEGWICHAFCLMTTHYHLLLEVPAESLKAGMQRLNGWYARRFNARHGRSGHLFGKRYSAKRVESDAYMLDALRYIVRNPVRAGICPRAADWLWSSYRGASGIDGGFPFVDSSRFRGYFGGDSSQSLAALRIFVDEAADLS